jgi:hypothetical protein
MQRFNFELFGNTKPDTKTITATTRPSLSDVTRFWRPNHSWFKKIDSLEPPFALAAEHSAFRCAEDGRIALSARFSTLPAKLNRLSCRLKLPQTYSAGSHSMDDRLSA